MKMRNAIATSAISSIFIIILIVGMPIEARQFLGVIFALCLFTGAIAFTIFCLIVLIKGVD